ncbi:MAG: serine hydrolase [Lachnospiraceae bacterium]
MKLQISELAKQAGVSVRTLHYYDTIGLLKPSGIDSVNGYRFYDENSLETLKNILHYRAHNFALKDIPRLMEENEIVRKQKLLEQRRKLQEKKEQLDAIIESIDTELATQNKLNFWFDKVLADYNYSGFTYYMNKEEYFFAWGMADYEKCKYFSLRSRFPVSILSSDFIVFCTLLLEEKGMLKTDDTIGTYISGCKYGDIITIRHLLDMSSGFSDELTEKWRNGQIACSEDVFYKKKSLETILEIIHYAPLKFVPGSQFAPCGLNYELLSIILERAGEAPLDDLLQHCIFGPLGMTNTSYKGTADIVGYSLAPSPKPIYWNYNDNNTSWGLLSTAEDLKRWFDALHDRRLLSEQGYKKLFSVNEDIFNCGLYKSRNRYKYSGDRNGISYEVTFDFEKDIFCLALRNKVPLPDNHDRLMYFTIPGCDDGQVRLEAWELDTDTFVKISSIRIFDKDAKLLYSIDCPKKDYLLYVENHGDKHLASEFVKDDSYYLTLDFAKLLDGKFDPATTYILEVRAECDSPQPSQIGIKYLRGGEEQKMGYYIFFNEIQPYELFLEALGNVMEVVR